MPTVAQIFAHTLKEIGVRYVFGVPSGNMIDYIEALRSEEGIDFILTGHEGAASIMADVCGRLTKIPGVCFGTFGPGATNLSTGVGGALLDRSPLLAFTDEMPEHLLERTVQMNINHQQLFHPITKYTTRLKAENIEEILLKAAGLATSEYPGSVHIGVPAGLGKVEAIQKKSTVDYLRLEKKKFAPLVHEQFKKIEKYWQKCTHPVLVIGLSAVRAELKQQLVAFAEKFQMPVVLTPMAKGMFPENHSLYAGVLFHALSNHVAEIYSKADLVIGAGYDPVEFNYEEWMPEVPLIHLDTREADIDKLHYPNVYNVIGTIENSLKELMNSGDKVKNWEVDFIESHKNKLFEKLQPAPNNFGPVVVVQELRKILPQEGILTVDVGAHLHLIGQQWQKPEPEKLIMTNGWSGMGFALPAAIAAKLCHPHLPVAAIMGDGGFLMMVGELATAKRLNLNIVFVVIYDNSLSLIRIKQQKKEFDFHYGTDLNDLPEEPTNHYFGVPVTRALNALEYQQALTKAFASEGPAVIEVHVDGKEYDTLVLQANKI